jgi:hypothetical protein
MMIEKLLSLLGLALNHENVKDFFSSEGLKYPKKETISNRSAETSFWVENKKKGYALLFGIQPYNPNYPLIQAEKKGQFIPLLAQVNFTEMTKYELPFGLNFKSSVIDIESKLGKPNLKSSDINKIWLKEDGTESFYQWRKPVDKQDNVFITIRYNTDGNVDDINIGIKVNQPLMEFYSELRYENFASVATSTEFSVKADIFFTAWAIKNKFISHECKTSNIIDCAFDYLQSLGRGYVIDSDFSTNHPFIRKYIKNMIGNDVFFSKEAAFSFLTNPLHKNNYLGEDAQKVLAEVELTEANFNVLNAIINKRYQEFKL